jgi:hypothetical protein
VGHGRKEEVEAKVPVWLINRAQHRIVGTDFPHKQEGLVRVMAANGICIRVADV